MRHNSLRELEPTADAALTPSPLGPSGAVSYAVGLGAQDLQLQAQNRGAHPNTLRCAPRTTGYARQ